MGLRVDEILEALPEVELQLWMLCDNGAEHGWYCVLHPRGGVPDNDKDAGRGASPLEALVAACAIWGINVEDDGT